jgi:hypothetical protein
VVLGKNYPAQMVDHARAPQHTLARFEQVTVGIALAADIVVPLALLVATMFVFCDGTAGQAAY